MNHQVHVLLFDGFADWEPSYALAELRRWGRHSVTTIGFGTSPITSMGGLRVVPDRSLESVRADEVHIFIMPGGDLWEQADMYPRAALEATLAEVIAAGRPVAAICAATLALARAGVLDERRHTSNAPEYLNDLVPSYAGAARYDPALAVRDRGIITASGLGPVDFAREIFAELELFSAADLELWYGMFRHGVIPASVAAKVQSRDSAPKP